MNKIIEKNNIFPCKLFMFFAPFFCGGFFEWTSCLFSLFLVGYLFYIWKKNGTIIFRKNLTVLAVAVVILFYGISALWGIDHGMSLVGFFKFLPLILFSLIIMQFEPEERTDLWDVIPVSGAAMTILSILLGQIPLLQELFFVNHRLAGFFMYTNAFAAFLLAGVIVLAGKKRMGIWQCLCLLTLLAGIVLSGSRTAFGLLAVVIFVFIIMLKGKMRLVVCLSMAGIVLASILYTSLTGNVQTFGRYLTTSIHDSTFVGRILYFKDALPIIAKHPFGLGYKGYFYTQGSFQTGVYSILNVHNELLQMLLDVGWIPAILFAISIVRSFFKKGKNMTERLVLVVMAAHAMFDFDLQFVCNGFVLLLAMDFDSGSGLKLRKRKAFYVSGIMLAGLCIWIGTASGLFYAGKNRAAVKLYPGYTDAWVDMLSELKDAEKMETIADEILSRNQSVSLAYSAKARIAYANGDFENMIQYKLKAISFSRYERSEYLDYFDMLYVGVQIYSSMGDNASAAVCIERLREIPVMMEEVLEGTDQYAWEIKDKPELTLPEEYRDALEKLQIL